MELKKGTKILKLIALKTLCTICVVCKVAKTMQRETIKGLLEFIRWQKQVLDFILGLSSS